MFFYAMLIYVFSYIYCYVIKFYLQMELFMIMPSVYNRGCAQEIHISLIYDLIVRLSARYTKENAWHVRCL